MKSCLALLVALCGLVMAAQATYFTCPRTYKIGPSNSIYKCKQQCPDDYERCLKGRCYSKYFYRGDRSYKCWNCTKKILSDIDGEQCCSDSIPCPTTPPRSCYEYQCLEARQGFRSCQKVPKTTAIEYRTTSGGSYPTCCDPWNDRQCGDNYYCDEATY